MRLVCAFLVFTMLTISAMATDFTAPITALDGKPIKEGGHVVTLSDVTVNALLAPYKDEPNLSGKDKLKRFRLAIRVQNNKDVSLSAEDISLIKRLIAKTYAPIVVGRAWPMLDPAGE